MENDFVMKKILCVWNICKQVQKIHEQIINIPGDRQIIVDKDLVLPNESEGDNFKGCFDYQYDSDEDDIYNPPDRKCKFEFIHSDYRKKYATNAKLHQNWNECDLQQSKCHCFKKGRTLKIVYYHKQYPMN